jgi:hypothetical protein
VEWGVHAGFFKFKSFLLLFFKKEGLASLSGVGLSKAFLE